MGARLSRRKKTLFGRDDVNAFYNERAIWRQAAGGRP
jgi:hypothetical protein